MGLKGSDLTDLQRAPKQLRYQTHRCKMSTKPFFPALNIHENRTELLSPSHSVLKAPGSTAASARSFVSSPDPRERETSFRRTKSKSSPVQSPEEQSLPASSEPLTKRTVRAVPALHGSAVCGCTLSSVPSPTTGLSLPMGRRSRNGISFSPPSKERKKRRRVGNF